jgi:hypothetical protein
VDNVTVQSKGTFHDLLSTVLKERHLQFWKTGASSVRCQIIDGDTTVDVELEEPVQSVMACFPAGSCAIMYTINDHQAELGSARGIYATAHSASAPKKNSIQNESVQNQLLLKLDAVFGGVIVLNAVVIGIETEFRTNKDDFDARWYAIEVIFAIVFSIELVIRVMLLGLEYFMSFGNFADAILVVVSVFDCFILTWFPDLLGGDGASGRIVGILRMLRLFKLARILRLFRKVRPLWLIVSGLMNSVTTICWTALLLGVFMYINAIILVQLLGHAAGALPGGAEADCDKFDSIDPGLSNDICEWFGNIPKALFTTTILATMEDWADIARPVMKVNFYWGLYFIFYLAVSGCAILNLIVGVVCDKTMEASRECSADDDADDKQAQVFAVQRLHETLRLLDTDGDGTISKDEIAAGYEHEEIGALLTELQVTKQLSEIIFHTLDKGKDVRLADFMDGIMLCKGLRNGNKDTTEIAALVPRLSQQIERLKPKIARLPMRQVDARITALPCMDSWRGRRFQSPGGTPANPAAGRLLNVGEGEHGAAVRY